MEAIMKYDVIVVGAGSMGMAAGYFLAKKGQRVLLIDAFDPPHTSGSHHGETRIIRYAYGEGEEYVPLALRAKELWEELEKESGRSFFLKTGVLSVGEETSSFIQTVISSAKTYSLPLEVLNAVEIHTRFPGITVPDSFIGCFEPTSGVLKCEDAIRTYKEFALKYGAELLTNHPVKGIKVTEDSVKVHTGDNVYEGKRLVLSAGAWSKELLAKLGLNLPATPIRKTFAWFEADEKFYGEGKFPAFSFDTKSGMYYGFPSIDGAGLKLGRHDGIQQAQNPNEEMAPFNDGDRAELENLLRSYMPQVGKLKFGKTCMYTMTPDENFIIDMHPLYKNVVFAAGFSGHGFKFSSAVGEVISDLLTTGKAPYDLSLFSASRWEVE
ncbi:N-methyl-L-tryptophan oxidase [Priestia flexa]|uniref:N-methyl-L-tryptophan oxidase n=1 Tax=Priestia flexa TaxID=86664 RepID=UPI001CFECA27|nr:N-methyl-L-tryptophan oxidase [Priestia flexa]